MNQTDKRRLLADVLTGNVDALQQYHNQRQAQHSPYRWVIDARVVGGCISTVDRQGKQDQMNEQDFERLPQAACVWKIIDYSGGQRTPAPDEDYTYIPSNS